MNLILLVGFFKTMVFCQILYSVNCRKYYIEEENTPLSREDLKGVLVRFRRTRDYMNILKDKMQQVKDNWAGMFAQVKYHFKTLMDTAIKEHIGVDTDTDTEDIRSNIETDNYYPNTSTASPVQILDEYSKKHQRLSANEKNSYKNIGYEYARRAIHTILKSMGVDAKDRPTKNMFLEDSTTKNERKTTTHKIIDKKGENSYIENKLKPQPATTTTLTTTTTTPTPKTTTTTPKPTTTTTTTTTKPCHVGYEYYALTGHCYMLHKETVPWAVANRTCIAEGARLAVVNSKDEQSVLVEVFRRTPPEEIHHADYSPNYVYIGLYRQSGVWWTVDGQTLAQAGFEEWGPGSEPQRGNWPYGIMNRQGTYSNAGGTYKYAFICEES